MRPGRALFPVLSLGLFVEALGHALRSFPSLASSQEGFDLTGMEIEHFTLVLGLPRPGDVAIASHPRTTVEVTDLKVTPGRLASSFLNVAYELSDA